MNDPGRLSKRIVRVESVLILLTTVAIAYGDYLVGKDVSLGYLYLVPLSYSAVTHRLRTTLVLVLISLVLRQWLGPLERSGWILFARDWVLTGIFLSLVTRLFRLGRDRRNLFETARKQRDELLGELERAAEVQKTLLTQHLPSMAGLDIYAQNWPAKIVGGDYFDFIDHSDGQLGIVIADVAGKGLPAALLMPAVRVALRAHWSRLSGSERILEELNRTLFDTTEASSYTTLFYGVLDLESYRLEYTNAGHLPPIVVRANGDTRLLETGGPPVGLLTDARFETGTVEFGKDDLLVLYTDGVVDGQNHAGEEFGFERLSSKVLSNRKLESSQLVEAIQSAVEAFTEGAQQFDDLTAMAIRFQIPSDGPLEEGVSRH